MAYAQQRRDIKQRHGAATRRAKAATAYDENRHGITLDNSMRAPTWRAPCLATRVSMEHSGATSRNVNNEHGASAGDAIWRIISVISEGMA